jgi:exosortase/archaeosortase family protein
MHWHKHHRWIWIFAPFATLWPVWLWMMERATDRSTDPWELVSLATAAVLIWQRGQARNDRPISLAAPIAFMLVYVCSYHSLPPLGRAIVAVMVIGACISAVLFNQRMPLALWGLLLLSLPLIASFNFYFGYPLRALAGSATAALLQMNGFSVVREGTLLAWNGNTIAVDAPCSGVKMLWTGCYFSCALAALHRLKMNATVILGAASFGLVIVSNVFRATALFFVEADIIDLPKDWHALIGIAIFMLTALGIAALAQKLSVQHYAA